MKLDFDPRKNITNFDYVIILFKKLQNKIHNFLVIRDIVKNWPDVLLFRLGVKRRGKFVMELENGPKIRIDKPQDYFDFWNTMDGQVALVRQKGYDRSI